MPKLSIIVPVYNVEKYLSECIQSLLNQTLRDVEIILVDDESPDGSPKMCDEYAKSDARVKVLHKKNGGLGYARNSGLDVASGEFVTFIDSDDYIDLDAYEIACKWMETYGLDELRFRCNRFRNDGSCSNLFYGVSPTVVGDKNTIRHIALCILDTVYKGDAKYNWGGSSCMAIYKSSIIKQYGLKFVSEREYVSEDYLFNFEYYMHATKVGFLNSTFYHYRINPNSLTRSIDSRFVEKAEIFARYAERVIADYGFHMQNKNYAIGYYVRALRVNMKQVFLSEASFREKRNWFKKCVASTYCKYAKHVYPTKNMPVKQKIWFYTMTNGLFELTYLLVVVFDKVRKDKIR